MGLSTIINSSFDARESVAYSSYIQKFIFTLRACARGKVIVFYVVLHHWHKNDQILRSRHLSDYNEFIKIGEKLGLVCFELFGTAHECHK